MISRKLYDNLDLYLGDVKNYIKNTYGEHYSNDIQVIDFIESLGTLSTTSRDKAIKYLARYGRKSGKNKKDLYKAMHYVLFMLALDHPPVSR